MLKTFIVLAALAFGSLEALTCCSNKDCSQTANCGANQNVCTSTWSINSAGNNYEVYSRSCSTGNPQEDHCSIDSNDGDVTCKCKGDRCNSVMPDILTGDTDRITCYRCKSGDNCQYSDSTSSTGANYGTELKCPKGVKKCKISMNDNDFHTTFRRDCDWESVDDAGEDFGSCGTYGSTSTCTCNAPKCNTGFHGIKCHSYVESTCQEQRGLEAEIVQCLTDTETCAVRTIDHEDIGCTSMLFNCGPVEKDKPSGCQDSFKLSNSLDTAEDCFCREDECDPRGSASAISATSGLFGFLIVLLINQ